MLFSILLFECVCLLLINLGTLTWSLLISSETFCSCSPFYKTRLYSWSNIGTMYTVVISSVKYPDIRFNRTRLESTIEHITDTRTSKKLYVLCILNVPFVLVLHVFISIPNVFEINVMRSTCSQNHAFNSGRMQCHTV